MQIGQDHYFGAAGQTVLTPLSIVALVLAIVLVFILPRKYVFMPILVAGLLIPTGQQIVLGGVHFMFIRILIPFGWIRLLSGRDQAGHRFRWTAMDTIFVAYCISDAVLYTVRWGAVGALINRAGFVYDAFGTYFLVRYLVRDPKDLDRLAKGLAWIVIVLAGFMLNEQITGRNVFSVFGGVREQVEVRDGKLRSQGPFEHTLTAGTFGAALLPIFVGLWWQSRKNRTISIIGITGSLLMAVCSMSSTPVLAFALGVFGLCMWPFRRYLRWFRWAAVGAIVSLHMVMKAPVWSLIERIDLTGSSSGYHRFELVDQFIKRFGEWWLYGTGNTYNWGWDMWDTCDAYVNAGTDGGVLTFILFVTLLTVGFWHLGMTRKAWSSSDRANTRRLWVYGAMLFANAVSFIGIAYFDSTAVAWYTELAMIATAISIKPRKRRPFRMPETSVPTVSGREVQTAYS